MRIYASAILGGALSGELSLIVDGGRHLADQSSSAIITFRENVKQMLRESKAKMAAALSGELSIEVINSGDDHSRCET